MENLAGYVAAALIGVSLGLIGGGEYLRGVDVWFWLGTDGCLPRPTVRADWNGSIRDHGNTVERYCWNMDVWVAPRETATLKILF